MSFLLVHKSTKLRFYKLPQCWRAHSEFVMINSQNHRVSQNLLVSRNCSYPNVSSTTFCQEATIMAEALTRNPSESMRKRNWKWRNFPIFRKWEKVPENPRKNYINKLGELRKETAILGARTDTIWTNYIRLISFFLIDLLDW